MTLKRCNQTTSEIDCANDEELNDYLNKHTVSFMTDRTFVDHENVEPGVGPIEHTEEWINTFELSFENPIINSYSAIEHQITLNDNLMQIMTGEVEFSLLNIDKSSKSDDLPMASMPNNADGALFRTLLQLSSQIQIEKRVVTSLPSIFGEFFGLYEVFSAITFILIGGIPAKLHLLDKFNSLFRAASLPGSQKMQSGA